VTGLHGPTISTNNSMSTSTEIERTSPLVVHRSTVPVHVIGHGRSGTSVFIRLLRKYLQIAFGTESQFVMRYYRRLAHYGDLADEANRRRLLQDICGERWFRRTGAKFDFATTPEEILADVREETYAGVLDAIFRQLAEHLGMQRWGDKTPEYLHDLPVLYELFPQAKFIHVVRDGRDVALSGFEMPFGEKNIFMAACDWAAAIEKVTQFSQMVPPSQFLEVRYEDFLAEPMQQFERLIRFLEVDDRSGALVERIEEQICDDLMIGNYGKWKQRLTRQQVERFDRIACRQLIQYEYEASVTETCKPSLWAAAYWTCDNYIRKRLRAGYWKDNLHRFGVRLNLQPGVQLQGERQ